MTSISSNQFHSVASGLPWTPLGMTGINIFLLLILFAGLLVQCGCAEVSVDVKALALLGKRVDTEIDAYEESADAICGVYIVDLRNGQTITARRIDKPLKPGSNMKLLTSAFVLAALGPDFAFTTSVYGLGGDVVIVGDGDMMPGAVDLAAKAGESVYVELDRWAAAIKEKLGANFTGDLIMCSQFDLTSSRPPAWEEHIYRYVWAPPTGGLNFHDNLLEITPTVVDGQVNVKVMPESRFFKVVNSLKVGEKVDCILKADADDSLFELTGTVSASTKDPFYLPVNHPELFMGRVLAERLILAGAPFQGKIRYVKSKQIDLSGAELLYQKKTPLAVSLKRMNIRSLNMPAECHYLQAGDGTWEGTIELLTKSMIENYHLRPESFAVDEGSGISGVDRVTPREIIRLLKAFLTREGGQLVIESIPRSGIEGTMTSDLTEPGYRGRVRGKIGHTHRGYCLSGYVYDKQKKPVILYSIMANDMPGGEEKGGKPLQNTICKLLVDYVDGTLRR